MSNNLIFETPHGSRLYGLSHENSDHDRYFVCADNRKAKQKIEGDQDVFEVGLAYFLDKAFNGSHQSLEALFSPYKVYHNESYAPMIEAAVVPTNLELREKYRRTIHKFSFGTFKQRRHALRLAINLYDLTRYGRFNPALDEYGVQFVTETAERMEGDELYQRALLRAGMSD